MDGEKIIKKEPRYQAVSSVMNIVAKQEKKIEGDIAGASNRGLLRAFVFVGARCEVIKIAMPLHDAGRSYELGAGLH